MTGLVGLLRTSTGNKLTGLMGRPELHKRSAEARTMRSTRPLGTAAPRAGSRQVQSFSQCTGNGDVARTFRLASAGTTSKVSDFADKSRSRSWNANMDLFCREPTLTQNMRADSLQVGGVCNESKTSLGATAGYVEETPC